RFKERVDGPLLPKTADQRAYEAQRDFIEALYAERGRRNENGELAHFTGSSPRAQDGIERRFKEEKARALDMLRSEYKGRVTF
ncbi:MAG TPA: hypothetical protein VEB39_03280, partial [Sphingomicrobium sp.]|nr:hypothetical protein [Sphingomicrobium sp.]